MTQEPGRKQQRTIGRVPQAVAAAGLVLILAIGGFAAWQAVDRGDGEAKTVAGGVTNPAVQQTGAADPMLFTLIMGLKPGLTAEQIQASFVRRATYKFPAGINELAEYWPSGPDQVIAIFEATDNAAIVKLYLDWTDLMDVRIYPAITGEKGLQAGQQWLQEKETGSR